MQKYKVTTWVTGKNLEKFIEIFKEQIELRPDFDEPDVFINGEGDIVIEVIIDGYSKDDATKLASEIIWELSSAILANHNFDVEVQNVEKAE